MFVKFLILLSFITLFSCGLNESQVADERWIEFDAITFSHNIFDLEENVKINLASKKENIAIKIKGKENVFELKTKRKATFLGKKLFSLFLIKDSIHFKNLARLHLFQKALKNQNLIGLKAKFLSVNVQGEIHEMYFQEGFDKRLIESNFNREGVIFTYTDKCKIQYNSRDEQGDELEEDIALLLNDRIHEWLAGNVKTECLIDVCKYGEFLAIKELLDFDLVPNLCFAYYLNPVSNLIEPFVFLDSKNKEDALSAKLTSDSTLLSFKRLTAESVTQIKNVIQNHKLARFSSDIVYEKKMDEIKTLESCYPSANFEQFFKEVAGEFVLISKSNVINVPVIIPPGLQVKFFPGDKIDIRQGGFVLSFSSIKMLGKKEYPIEVLSSDGLGSGFHIINARNESKLRYVNFSGLSRLNYKSWKLPSAVTFYESPVEINFCSFSNNHCEDAVNFFRCTPFLITNSTVANTFSDGLDVDFSDGTVKNCKFVDCGNDGIDISGSKIIVKKSSFRNIADKALSAGEASDITIDSVSIDGVSLAVVAKDLSKVEISNSNISTCEVVYCAYQKKREFGPSSISAKKVTCSNFKEENLIEEGSKLKVNGEKIHNYRVNVRKYLYGKEYGKETVK